MATRTTSNISLSAAKGAITAAERKAHSLSLDFNIAVVDSTLHLLSFARMPNAKLTSISIAIDKAYTAAGHRTGTHNYKEAVWPGGAAFGLGNTNGGRFVTIGGGLPFVNEKGEVIGAIGVSTGTPDQDRQVAQAGVDAVQELLKEEGRQVKAKL